MKMTIITDASGKLVGAVQGHTLSSNNGGVEANLSFDKAHKMHKVDVDDDMERITDPAMFQDRLLKHMPRA